MNEQFIDSLLDSDIPEADLNAKKTAINQASTEFTKAFSESTRSTSIQSNKASGIFNAIRSFIMSTDAKPRISATFPSLAIAFIAISLVYLLPSKDEQLDGFIKRNDTMQVESVKNGAHINSENKSISNDDESLNSSLEEIVVTSTRVSHETEFQPSLARDLIAGRTSTDSASQASPQSIPLRKTKKISQFRSNGPLHHPLQLGDAAGSSRHNQDLFSSNNALPNTHEPNGSAEPRPELNEEYADYQENLIKQVTEEPVSTFSVDVDTASYSLVRNQLNRGYLPPVQAVRAEEFINYFNYNYALPESKEHPFEPTISVLDSPWNTGRKLIHIGIKAFDIKRSETPDSNIVLLLDVSGSMRSPNKLPLLKQSIGLLLDTLKPSDTISIAVYAGAAGTVLVPTKVEEKTKILASLNQLSAGGSTAGAQGIRLAYQLAETSFKEDAVNRIILATDGDFNIGLNNNKDLKTLVERKRDEGIYLSVLGFGRNNYQDDMMQTLAQSGNGIAAYIDTLSEAKKVLIDEATSTLFPVANDVKIQVEFNPRSVADYRLVGYETRALNREDFNNDSVDAGDIGAGHNVTAIYEITPLGAENPSIDELRYKAVDPLEKPHDSETPQEYGFLKIRYKLPDGKKSWLIEKAIKTEQGTISSDVRFSTAVAGFAQLLANNAHTGDLTFDEIIEAALAAKGSDEFGYRSEFIQLVRMAKIAQP